MGNTIGNDYLAVIIHFDGINSMQQLLENEGLEVVDNAAKDIKKKFWEPEVED